MTGVYRFALALASGACTVFAFSPFHVFPLTLLTFGILVWLWQSAQTPRAAMWLGFAFGLGLFLTGVSWIYVSLHEFGGLAAPLAVAATVLFCAVISIYPAISGWLFKRLETRVAWRDALLAASAWTFTEWLRGWVLTGFPWLALGYSHAPPSPWAGFAPVVGVYGLSFLTVWLAAWCLLGWRAHQRVAPMFTVFGMIVLGLGIAKISWTHATGRPLSVSLLQGNVEQSIKWRPERVEESLRTYLQLARRHPAQLVILPETALPLWWDQVPAEYLTLLSEVGGGDVLTGVASRNATGSKYFNSAFSFGLSAVQHYHKRHLVPFGEFTPALFEWTLQLLQIPMSNFDRGVPDPQPLSIAGQRVGVNICYEDVFGEEIIDQLPAATMLVNLSNTAWFGHSLAQPQHLQIAQMRAMEAGRPMLRATNTGMTAIVNYDGTVAAVLPPFQTGALSGLVEGREGVTPFVRMGNGFVLGVTITLLLGFALHARRRLRRVRDDSPQRVKLF